MRMKQLLLASAFAVLALSPPSYAADVAANIPAAYDWSGFYAGVQIGYNAGSSKNVPWDSTGIRPLSNNDGPADLSGFIGGVHTGYNYQLDRVVFGLEADVNFNKLSGDDEDRGDDTNGIDMDLSGSIRARAGFAMDRTLIYATGGWAFMNGDGTISSSPGSPIFQREKTSLSGWTIGAGVEHAFTQKITGRLEYRYTDYGLTVEEYGGYDLGFKPQVHAITVGMSYKF